MNLPSRVVTSSVHRGKLFRKLKERIKEFERAAELMRFILSNNDSA
jgi:hypothetical protein